MRRYMLLLVAGLFLGGCDDALGPQRDGPQVGIQFALSGSSSASVAPAGTGLLRALGTVAMTGTNGTLELDTIHVIVAEFELERTEGAEDACEDDRSGSDDDCEEFDVGPTFVNLPLDAGPTTAVTASVPPGSYEEVEFEVEDLDDDEENTAERQRIAELTTSIRAQFPDWPRDASMRVAGTFTPTGGTPRPFVAYFEAEIEVEREFDTPFVVTEDDVSRTITVELNPSLWFSRVDGTVMDLSAFDFATTGRLLEFEVEMEHGFERVEHDDD